MKKQAWIFMAAAAGMLTPLAARASSIGGAFSVTMTIPDVPDESPTNPDGFTSAGAGEYYAGPSTSVGATYSDWLVAYTDVTFSDSSSDGFYEEFNVPSGDDEITIVNDPAGPDTLSGAGYFISESYIPLDQLNYSDTPPPGSGSSPFTPLPSLDKTIPDGGSEDAVVPLPAAAWGGLALLGGLAAVPRLRRRLPG